MDAVVALSGTRAEGPFTSRYRITYVLHRTDPGWLVVNSHATLLGVA